MVRNNNSNEAITRAEYDGFQCAYDYFNTELFEGTLPQLLITLQRKANSSGHFHPKRFTGRVENAIVHELNLNPDSFTNHSDEEILGTLVHEQAHVWQHTFGKPSRGAYHNAQWADKMEQIGLMPSSTGAAGGGRTGQRMSDYIIAGGPYQLAYRKLAQTGSNCIGSHTRSLPAPSCPRSAAAPLLSLTNPPPQR